jgi:hypothetical protein
MISWKKITDVEKSAEHPLNWGENIFLLPRSRDVLMVEEARRMRDEIIWHFCTDKPFFLRKFSADISRFSDYVTWLLEKLCLKVNELNYVKLCVTLRGEGKKQSLLNLRYAHQRKLSSFLTKKEAKVRKIKLIFIATFSWKVSHEFMRHHESISNRSNTFLIFHELLIFNQNWKAFHVLRRLLIFFFILTC